MFSHLGKYKNVFLAVSFGIFVSSCASNSPSESIQARALRHDQIRNQIAKLESYVLKNQSESSFLNDGWSAGDAWRGTLGVIGIKKNEEIAKYAIGLLANDQGIGDGFEPITTGNFMLKLAREGKEVSFGLANAFTQTGNSIKYNLDDKRTVCILTFIQGTLSEKNCIF